MEFIVRARALLRALLTLAVLCYSLDSHAAIAAVPEGDVDTFVDDEDAYINGRTTGLKFSVELSINVACGEWIKKNQDAVIEKIRAQMLSDIRTDCQCHHPSDSENVTSKEKIDCKGANVEYSGEIPNWNSPTYSVHRLQQFLSSWSAAVTIVDSNFVAFPNFDFIFNTTRTQVTPIVIEDFGSGEVIDDVVSEVDDMGSGTSDFNIMVTSTGTMDANIENTTDPDNDNVRGNFTSGQTWPPHAHGFTVTLSIALGSLLSFVCFV